MGDKIEVDPSVTAREAEVIIAEVFRDVYGEGTFVEYRTDGNPAVRKKSGGDRVVLKSGLGSLYVDVEDSTAQTETRLNSRLGKGKSTPDRNQEISDYGNRTGTTENVKSGRTPVNNNFDEVEVADTSMAEAKITVFDDASIEVERMDKPGDETRMFDTDMAFFVSENNVGGTEVEFSFFDEELEGNLSEPMVERVLDRIREVLEDNTGR